MNRFLFCCRILCVSLVLAPGIVPAQGPALAAANAARPIDAFPVPDSRARSATPSVPAGTTTDITVGVGHPGTPIQPTMWGIFFEDINMAADGGVYAELVKNRSFEFNMPLMGWQEHKDAPADGSILVLNRSGDNPANPRFIRMTHLSGGAYGLSNEGFRGMGIKENGKYRFSVWARPLSGASLTLRIELVTPQGQKIASARLPLGCGGGNDVHIAGAKGGGGNASAANSGTANAGGANAGWQMDTISFTATATESRAQLYIWLEGTGAVDLDMISLFPQDTWRQRPGGLRADLVQLLADMHPGFLRFPGGCIVEGRDLTNRYQWKKTVGPTESRQQIINRWNTEFAHRPTPDYYQSFGLGFFEYFQLAEDIGASPLPILNCGMACQFNTAEVVPAGDLDPYIRDALDLIEFANGPVTSSWGALRASMGHPAPFNLKLMGVGNEQWGPQYIERYRIFTKAIKDKYPDIRLVNSVGPNPDGDQFNFLNDTLRKLHADILDEHYYREPGWFLQHAGRYDHYDRNGPKIFAGEYAAQSKAVVSPLKKNNWQCALSEAAYMTGLERNADVVYMASYAPLFAHVDGWQWTPDLIWYDNLRSYGTPDYYVQKLFSTNRGSVVVPMSRVPESGMPAMSGVPATSGMPAAGLQGPVSADPSGVRTADRAEMAGAGIEQPLTGQDGLYGSACIDNSSHELILKIVNTTAGELRPGILLEGWTKSKSSGKAFVTVLRAGRDAGADLLETVNSLDDPMTISPVTGEIAVRGRRLSPVLAPYSFTVIRVKL